MMIGALVGNGRSNHPDDLLNLRRAFTGLQRYDPSRDGLGSHIDRPLVDAITGYQRDRGLRVDGWLRPGGPTQRRIEDDLGARWVLAAEERDARPRLHIDLPSWTPLLVDPETGRPILAPDGRPYALTPERTRELIDLSR